MKAPMNPIPIPRWARISIALACAGIGLASSTVNGSLLVRGLELTEPDASSRAILIASSVLMIVTELAAFFLASLLPSARLYRLRIMGVALWAFGVITIFGTRLVLNHNADAAVVAQDMRIDNLKASIASRMADASRVRASGERQNASDHAWTRHLGTLAIKQADAMEREIEPLREELISMQAQQRTTMPRVLGPELALAQSIAMPVLISTIGLTLFGVAGGLLRREERAEAPQEQRREPAVTTPPDPSPSPVAATVAAVEERVEVVGDTTVTGLLAVTEADVPAVTGSVTGVTGRAVPAVPGVPAPIRVHQEHRTAAPAGTVPAVPQATSPMTAWRSIAVAVPLSAMSVSPAAMAAPADQEASIEAATHSEEAVEIPPAAQQPEHQEQKAEPVHALVPRVPQADSEHQVHGPVQQPEHQEHQEHQEQPEHDPEHKEHEPVQPTEAPVTTPDDRYQRLRAGVLAGEIKPNVRALRDAGGAGTETVRRYIRQLADEGVIVPAGKGYALADQRPPDSHTKDLFA